ncbi:hypothetical protein FD755_000542 [Muntiacus reevesi]|uniref:Serine aminopeptidase S33 domain-containing protein n=1 Tax=Muntiacus reevesi TaxID=9886 RepID=A0A5J5MZC8_MUNRE|nr:hypothetical protein FD755_000542 [Muntiacus reevesi]
MNGLSVTELCCLFCCPPCPGRIAAKLAFLPPEPTYLLVLAGTPGRWKLHLMERADFQYSQRELHTIEVFLTKSSRGNRISCMYVRWMSSFYIGLGTRINCNIFSYDYSGYGVSSGKPSEKNLYADIDAACPDSVVLYGQGIGTVPTMDLASLYECAAVVLRSPLTSGMRKVSKITSPMLIIHGMEDEVIDFSHGLVLYERHPKAVEPLWVEGAGRNDIELYSQYLERLRRFISQELPTSAPSLVAGPSCAGTSAIRRRLDTAPAPGAACEPPGRPTP